MISEVGYGNASLALIAKHAGVSKGVISYHFDGKDDLMTQLVIQLYFAGGEFMAPRIGRAVGPRAQLLTYLESNLDFIAANRNYVAAMTDVVVNLREEDGSLKFASVDGEREIIAPLLEMLREGKRVGDFGDFDATLMAESIRDVIDGVAGRVVRDPEFDIAAYSAHVCRVFDVATRKGRSDD
ncbi:hypothetical protein GCM10023318_26260 [Nocardia callitridis]|uniref:HTH tetR-type domain-containing protein n=1 Tax=Nocardia callitridis TaxID=648753 RepID=A0ABP9K9R1_9NOCA